MNSLGPNEFGLGTEDVSLTCDKHGAYLGKVVQFGARRISSRCPVCSEEHKAEEEARARRERKQAMEAKIRALVGHSGIPTRYRERTFDNYRADADGQRRALAISRAYAERFEERLAQGGGLVMCGRPGTGKTHLAAAIGNYVIRHFGRTVLFVTVLRAVRTVKETWNKDCDRTEQEALNEFLAPDLLVLDEVGVQFGSEAERLILFEIINGRYESMRPTILISNLPVDELEQYIGARAMDRMREGGGAVLAFDWDSYRPRVHKDDQLPGQQVEPVSWMQVPGERGAKP